MVRFGRKPDRAMMRAASTVHMAPVPLSVYRSEVQESRCAPTMTSDPDARCRGSRDGVPLSHGITSDRFEMLTRAARRARLEQIEQGIVLMCDGDLGKRQDAVGEPLMLRSACSLLAS